MSTFGNIPTNILKLIRGSCSDTLQELYKVALRHGNFSDNQKCGVETPILNPI